MRCVNCQNEVPSYASVCPFCGELVKGKAGDTTKEWEHKLAKVVQRLGGKEGEGRAEGGKVFTVMEEKGEVTKGGQPAIPTTNKGLAAAKLPAGQTTLKASLVTRRDVESPDLVPARHFLPLLISVVALVLAGGGVFAWYQGLLPGIINRPAPAPPDLPSRLSVYDLLPDDTVAWLEYDWVEDQAGETRRAITRFWPFVADQLPGSADWEAIIAELQVDVSPWLGPEVVLAINQKAQASLLFAWQDQKKGEQELRRFYQHLQKYGWRPSQQEPGPGPKGQWPGEPVVLTLGRSTTPAPPNALAKKEEQLAFAFNDRWGSISTDPFYAKQLVTPTNTPTNAPLGGNPPSGAFARLRKQLNESLASQQPLRLYVRPDQLNIPAELVGQPTEELASLEAALAAWSGLAVDWSLADGAAAHSVLLPAQVETVLKEQPRYKATLAGLLPANVPLVFSTSGLGLEAVLSKLFNLRQQGRPALANFDWTALLAALSAQGFDLRTNFLRQLSQETILTFLPSTAANSLFGYEPVLVARVNQATVESGLRALEQAVGSLYRQALPGNYVVQEKVNDDGTLGFEWLPLLEASHFAEQTYQDITIRYFAFSKKLPDYTGSEFGFYYSLTDDYLVIADQLETVQRIIDVAQKNGPSLTKTDLFNRAQLKLPAQIYGYLYLDLTKVGQTAQPLLEGLMSALPTLPESTPTQLAPPDLTGALLLYEAGERDVYDTTFKWLPAEKAAGTSAARSVIEDYMKYTLGTIPGAKIDYEAAKKLLTPDLVEQFNDPAFVPTSYCIQDGPTDVRITSEVQDKKMNRTNIIVEAWYDNEWLKMWNFQVVPVEGDSWMINKIECL